MQDVLDRIVRFAGQSSSDKAEEACIDFWSFVNYTLVSQIAELELSPCFHLRVVGRSG